MSKYEALVHGDDALYVDITPRLRMRKYGSWLIKEKKQQARIAKERSRQLLAIVQLAKKISVEKNVSIDDAYLMINQADTPENASITSDYIDEVTAIVESSISEAESDAMILTLFLRSRVEGLIDGSWTRLSDWSDQDTEILDEQARIKIVEFINAEQSGGSSVEDDDEEEKGEQGSEGNGKKASTTGSKPKSTASESSSSATTGTDATQESPLVA